MKERRFIQRISDVTGRQPLSRSSPTSRRIGVAVTTEAYIPWVASKAYRRSSEVVVAKFPMRWLSAELHVARPRYAVSNSALANKSWLLLRHTRISQQLLGY